MHRCVRELCHRGEGGAVQGLSFQNREPDLDLMDQEARLGV
jgi:hypothetical protein